MNKTMPIGVFDSGVGGLTVLKELRQLMPQENFVYFGDTGRNPYGPRAENEVRGFVAEILAFMASNHVKLAVAACNTITVLGLDTLRKNCLFPMLGVSNGAKLAVTSSQNKRIGVIATEGTIRSGKHVAAILAADPSAQVFPQACSKFAPLVEAEQINSNEIELAAKEYLQPLKEAGIDTLVLACTHYPMLSALLQKEMGQSVTLIDPARETALETLKLLQTQCMLNGQEKGNCKLYFSADVPRAKRIASQFMDISCCDFALALNK